MNEPSPDARDQALLELLRHLAAVGYEFVTPTPCTHERVVARPGMECARGLRDIFGWSLPFDPEEIDLAVRALLDKAGAMEAHGPLARSRYRVSSLDGRLFLHSAFPTQAADAVFFGPDSYRFVDFLRAELSGVEAADVVIEIGAGSGVGALSLSGFIQIPRLILTDINPKALRLARINAEAAATQAQFVQASILDGIDEDADLIVANAPFIADTGRIYSDGGAGLGSSASLEWARAGCRRLRPGGRMLLYTASAIVQGEDQLKSALKALARAEGLQFGYREIDPDIFGEELDRPVYATAERIAAVGATFLRSRSAL